MSNMDMEIEYLRMKGDNIESSSNPKEIKLSVIQENNNTSLKHRSHKIQPQNAKAIQDIKLKTQEEVKETLNATIQAKLMVKSPSMISIKKPPNQTQKQRKQDKVPESNINESENSSQQSLTTHFESGQSVGNTG